MQISATWTTSAVPVTLNRGAFDDLRGKWLYVVDDAGAVNEKGFEIPPLPQPTCVTAHPGEWVNTAVAHSPVTSRFNLTADRAFRPSMQ